MTLFGKPQTPIPQFNIANVTNRFDIKTIQEDISSKPITQGEEMNISEIVSSSATALGKIGAGEPVTIGGITIQQQPKTIAEANPPANTTNKTIQAVAQAQTKQKNNAIMYIAIGVLIIGIIWFVVLRKRG
jgi:hypothetical protein